MSMTIDEAQALYLLQYLTSMLGSQRRNQWIWMNEREVDMLRHDRSFYPLPSESPRIRIKGLLYKSSFVVQAPTIPPGFVAFGLNKETGRFTLGPFPFVGYPVDPDITVHEFFLRVCSVPRLPTIPNL